MIRDVLWRWWGVYQGTRDSVSWSGVFSGGDGVCTQGTRHSVSWSGSVLWRWWSVYLGTRHSVSWSGVIYRGDAVCIQELDTMYHDQGCSLVGDGVYIQELNTLYHDSKMISWRWWSVYPGTRHTISWSGVISGGDGVCIEELDTLYHDQGWSLEVMECVSRTRNTASWSGGDLWRWWSVYPGTRKLETLHHDQGWCLEVDWSVYPETRHSVSWSKVSYAGDGVCIQELDTLYHDQEVISGICIQKLDTLYHDQWRSLEVMESASRN